MAWMWLTLGPPQQGSLIELDRLFFLFLSSFLSSLFALIFKDPHMTWRTDTAHSCRVTEND
jgi:hypothetical protein